MYGYCRLRIARDMLQMIQARIRAAHIGWQESTHKLPRAGLLRDPESSTAALPLWRKIPAIQEATP
jgi:hypothetical protein